MNKHCKLCGAETDKEYCTPEHRRIIDNMYTGEGFYEYCERRAKMLLKKKDKQLAMKKK